MPSFYRLIIFSGIQHSWDAELASPPSLHEGSSARRLDHSKALTSARFNLGDVFRTIRFFFFLISLSFWPLKRTSIWFSVWSLDMSMQYMSWTFWIDYDVPLGTLRFSLLKLCLRRLTTLNPRASKFCRCLIDTDQCQTTHVKNETC